MICDPDGAEVPPRTEGEVWLRSGQESPTYRYVGAEARRRAGGWESLGDHGYVDEDGYLYLGDRMQDMILTGGANVYPAEVSKEDLLAFVAGRLARYKASAGTATAAHGSSMVAQPSLGSCRQRSRILARRCSRWAARCSSVSSDGGCRGGAGLGLGLSRWRLWGLHLSSPLA
ncbi:MAG: hypothetical protein ACRD08_03425, partial [Acidimicrobiales bacterium]